MDLSYEETMRRIAEWERTDFFPRAYWKEQKYPYYVNVYFGEDQVVIVPLVTAAGGYRTGTAWFLQILDVNNSKLIGEKVLEAIAHIKVSPVDARTPAERKEGSFLTKVTTCKNFKELHRKYYLSYIIYEENGEITVSPLGHDYEKVAEYDTEKGRVTLPPNTAAETIGQVLLRQHEQMEAFYQNRKRRKPARPRVVVDTLSAGKLSFEALQDEHYVDEEDYGVAEVYQGYGYYKESAEEAVADLCVSIAAELDCDLSYNNICSVYQSIYGDETQVEIQEVRHPVFEKRIEVISKEVHHIIYVKQVDESELLAWELKVKRKPAGKRIYAKVMKDFEMLVESSVLE